MFDLEQMTTRTRPPAGVVSCKVGTQPALCVFDKRSSFVVGKRVRFRDAGPGHKWDVGLLTNIDPIRVDLI